MPARSRGLSRSARGRSARAGAGALARPVWGTGRLGIASVVLGALSFVALRRVLTMPGDPAQRRFTAALFGGVTLLFLTAAIPILLDKEWITVAWALEAGDCNGVWGATTPRERRAMLVAWRTSEGGEPVA